MLQCLFRHTNSVHVFYRLWNYIIFHCYFHSHSFNFYKCCNFTSSHLALCNNEVTKTQVPLIESEQSCEKGDCKVNIFLELWVVKEYHSKWRRNFVVIETIPIKIYGLTAHSLDVPNPSCYTYILLMMFKLPYHLNSF